MAGQFPESEAARTIRRGVMRWVMEAGWAAVPEVTLVTGRRLDLLCLERGGILTAIEVKSGLADFRADSKWQDYRGYADRFAFAVDREFPLAVLPEDVGVILADAWGAEWLRPPPDHPLSAARRKAMLIRFAMIAGRRLAAPGLPDPEGAS
ncbi:MAG: MmcB family DNA repair protein [Alphaproteobacteria bacterium]|nr:MmcB family DNA repair protein [Alphaproteobacteria bacterium]